MDDGAPPPPEGMIVRDWNQITSELVFIYDSDVDSRHLTLHRTFQDMSAILIRQGTATLKGASGKTFNAGPGDWILASQGERFQEFTPRSSVLSIHFLLSWPGRIPVYDWGDIVVVPSDTFPGMAQAGEQLMQYVQQTLGVDGRMVRHSPTPLPNFFGLYQHLYHWLQFLVTALASRNIHPSRQGTVDPRVLKAAQILDRRPLRKPLHQAELAAEVNLSINQLTRVFRQHFHMTPKAYMERRRAREAYLRVQNSNNSFKEIAYALGFYSPAHFSTWFGQRFEHTPREVREHGHILFPHQL